MGGGATDRFLWELGFSSRFFSSGNFRISWPSPGCIARITPARESGCCPLWTTNGDATFRQIVCTSAILVWVSALPSVLGMAGIHYFFGALVLGMLLLQVGLWANRSRTNVRAKWLMHATVAHIPLLLVWMILDKLTR